MAQLTVTLNTQNMTNYPQGDVFGTDLVKELRALNFSGLLFIRSANTEDEELYLTSGATAMLHKTVKAKEIGLQLAKYYTSMMSNKVEYY